MVDNPLDLEATIIGEMGKGLVNVVKFFKNKSFYFAIALFLCYLCNVFDTFRKEKDSGIKFL